MIQVTSVVAVLRRERVDATGLHFHQAVSPVGPVDTEIVDGSPQDTERLPLQGELRGVGTQAHFSAHPPFPCWHAGRFRDYLCHTGTIQHIDYSV